MNESLTMILDELRVTIDRYVEQQATNRAKDMLQEFLEETRQKFPVIEDKEKPKNKKPLDVESKEKPKKKPTETTLAQIEEVNKSVTKRYDTILSDLDLKTYDEKQILMRDLMSEYQHKINDWPAIKQFMNNHKVQSVAELTEGTIDPFLLELISRMREHDNKTLLV